MYEYEHIKHAARVSTLCLEFIADEVEAGRMQPEDAVKAMRICAAYAKTRLPRCTVAAWPEAMRYFKTVIWKELLGQNKEQDVKRVM